MASPGKGESASVGAPTLRAVRFEGLTQDAGDAGGLGQILLLMGETGAQMECGMSACFTVGTHRDMVSMKELFISELAHRVC